MQKKSRYRHIDIKKDEIVAVSQDSKTEDEIIINQEAQKAQLVSPREKRNKKQRVLSMTSKLM